MSERPIARKMPSATATLAVKRVDIRLFYLDALRREAERIEASVSDDAKVGGRRNGDARIIVRRVLDRVGVEPLGAKLEHGGHGRGNMRGMDRNDEAGKTAATRGDGAFDGTGSAGGGQVCAGSFSSRFFVY